ncbi:helix-turn-helix domain-containing protein [Nocardia sp. NPDC005998]|uniref:winged helix-turn-helix transcriptional regulator n=1 Tax=Nocardia sp. NPDC005998 TaxID=3156894 RepID=UPI0033AA93BF
MNSPIGSSSALHGRRSVEDGAHSQHRADGAGELGQTFTEFQQRLGIARNILTDRLRRLVEHGILTTSTTPGGKRHSYQLSEAGQDLFTVVVALRQWGERHAFTSNEPHSTLVDRDGSPVAQLRTENHEGKLVTAATTQVRKVGRHDASVADATRK